MEFISLTWWQLLTMVVVTLLAGILPTWLTNYFQNKNNKKQATKDMNRTKAENLYAIIKPVLKSHILTHHKPYSNKQGSWKLLTNLLDTRIELDSYLNQLLTDKKPYIYIKDLTNLVSDLQELLLLGLIRKYELEEFIARYAPGSSYKNLKFNIELLNKDIQFINKTLGLYIPEYKED